jgi:hypothetical protein
VAYAADSRGYLSETVPGHCRRGVEGEEPSGGFPPEG